MANGLYDIYNDIEQQNYQPTISLADFINTIKNNPNFSPYIPVGTEIDTTPENVSRYVRPEDIASAEAKREDADIKAAQLAAKATLMSNPHNLYGTYIGSNENQDGWNNFYPIHSIKTDNTDTMDRLNSTNGKGMDGLNAQKDAVSANLPSATSTDMPYGMNRFSAQNDAGTPIEAAQAVLSAQGFRPLGLQGATPTAFGDTVASAEPVKRVSAPMSFSQLPKEQQAILLQQEQQRVWGNAPQQTQHGALAALPAVSEVSNVQSGRSAPDMSGKQYENVEYRIPGVTGYASGLRQVDPNRPKGTSSVVPGLSDAERQQAELLRAKEERQAAYRAGNGPQYDALAQQKMQYMMELGKAQIQAARDQAKEQRAQDNANRAYNFNKEKTAYQTRMNLFKELDPGPYKPTNFMEQFGKYREATMATDPEKALPDYLSNQHGIPTATDEEQKMYLKALASDKQASVPPLYYDPVSKKINVLGKDKQYYSLPWLQALNNYEKQKYDEARRSALSILSKNQ